MMRTALFRPVLGLAAFLAALAAPAGAVTIDNFESLDNWITFADAAGSTITISTDTGVSGNALKMSYDLTAGNYAGMYNSTLGGLNFTTLGANALQFSYRAGSLANTIQIQFADSDNPDPGLSTKKTYTFKAVADDAWHEVLVPISSFATWTDTGNGVFNETAVSHLSFGVTKNDGVAGSDTVRFDNFSLYYLDGATPLVPLINSYETPVAGCWVANTCVNERTPPLASGYAPLETPAYGFSTIVTTESYTGSQSREITYTLPGAGFLALYEVLGGIPVEATDSLQYFAKGAAGGEPLEIEVKSAGQVANVTPVAPTTSWAQYNVTFADCKAANALLDLNAITEVVFVFKDNSGAGKVYIDDVSLHRPAAVSRTVKTLEDFSGARKNLGYPDSGGYAHADAQMTFEFEKDLSVPGASSDNKVGRIDYSFAVTASTPYAVTERPLGVNLLAEQTLRFRFKGSGANSDVEIILADADGTAYRKVVPDASNTGGVWKTASIPVDNFSFFAVGADANLKLTRISLISFVAARGEAKAGDISFDLMESTVSRAYDKGSVGAVLTSLGTPDNPFSPNGDGLKDVFKVEYTLSQLAGVVMKIYNLQGVPIKTIDAGEQLAGSHVLTWDGVADNGRLVANGLYMYAFEAKGSSAGTDTLKQIVAVMR